jgi:hypothetical protein
VFFSCRSPVSLLPSLFVSRRDSCPSEPPTLPGMEEGRRSLHVAVELLRGGWRFAGRSRTLRRTALSARDSSATRLSEPSIQKVRSSL